MSTESTRQDAARGILPLPVQDRIPEAGEEALQLPVEAAPGGQAAAGRSRRRRTGRRMTRRQRRALVFRRRMALVCTVLLLVLCGIGIWNLRQQNHAPKSEYTISDACEAYRTEVEELADQYDMTEYVDLIMAVMMQESSGRGLDVMQSSEGQFNTEYPREPNGITDPSYSIACGIQELRHALILAEASGPRDISAIELALQGYNFGADSYFAFMKEQKEKNGLMNRLRNLPGWPVEA